ncbi:nitric oxide synthase oxygenase [Saccharopolyspora phatthalungensis]|uniref:nitric oxide synthase oxygenase n=1 Tax=Saccharopolyspora phatthalungensis TaxID=664693 RepID=UPI0035E45FF8
MSTARHADNVGENPPLVFVFARDPLDRPGPCIWNEKVVRYSLFDGGVPGAPVQRIHGRGGAPGNRRARGRFDHLPLVVETAHAGPTLVGIHRDRSCRRARWSTRHAPGSSGWDCIGTPCR